MKNLTKLSDVELEIMNAIWKINTPVTIKQLLDIFEEKEWKNSTMATFLFRLVKKGFLKKTIKKKVSYYIPSITLQEYKIYETKDFVNRIHGGDLKSFMVALTDENSITLKEIHDLKEWFEKEVGDL